MTSLITKFKNNISGAAPAQAAVLFAAVGFAMVVLLVPMLDDVSKEHAFKQAVGIDTMVTSSIKKDSSTRRVVRKSVLDEEYK